MYITLNAMQLKQFPVRNPLLYKYIDYYYLLATDNTGTATRYIAYPSINTPLGFFEQCKVELREELTVVKNDPKAKIISILAGNFTKPVHISIGPGVKEFAIVFKPIGINCLFKRNLGKLLEKGLVEMQGLDFLKAPIAKIFSGELAFDELEEQILRRLECTLELKKLEQVMGLLSMNEVH